MQIYVIKQRNDFHQSETKMLSVKHHLKGQVMAIYKRHTHKVTAKMPTQLLRISAHIMETIRQCSRAGCPNSPATCHMVMPAGALNAVQRSCVCVLWHSVLFDSLQLYGLQPTRLLCPWDFPGSSTGVGCHFLLQGIFLTQGSNSHLLHWQVHSLSPSHLGIPYNGHSPV